MRKDAVPSFVMRRMPPCCRDSHQGMVGTQGRNAAPKPVAYLNARDQDKLRPFQAGVACKAEGIMRGLARVGIAALVDEATGYQNVRAANALAKVLEDFMADDYRKWTVTFPIEFYLEIARLKGWDIRKDNGRYRWPQVVGHYTNNFVYERLAPGVLEELRTKNPADHSGRRKRKHHQWLKGEIGHPRLMAHLEGLKMIMRYCDTWELFGERVDKEYRRYRMTDLGFETEITKKPNRPATQPILNSLQDRGILRLAPPNVAYGLQIQCGEWR